MDPIVGVRELQQHASSAVRRAAASEEVGVTNRGRLAARHVPVDPDPLDALVSEGLARPASRQLRDFGEPLVLAGERSLGRILAVQREHER